MLRITNYYGRLRHVMLAVPSLDAFEGIDPVTQFFRSMPDVEKVRWELDRYAQLLRLLGVAVDTFTYGPGSPNTIFLRDLALIIDDCVLLANPRYTVRKGEENLLKTALFRMGVSSVKIFQPWTNVGTYEGADTVFDGRWLLTSVGGRSSSSSPLEDPILTRGRPSYTCNSLPEGIPQHLLGRVQPIAPDTVLARTELSMEGIRLFGHVIGVPETDEIVSRFGMNIAVLAPKVIIMPEGAPKMARFYEAAGLTVFTTPMSEVQKMGGGLTCITLPLRRDG